MQEFKGVKTLITDLNSGRVCVHYIYDENYEDYEIVSVDYKGINILDVVSDEDHARLVEKLYNNED